MEIPSVKERKKIMDEMIETTSYHPKKEPERDKDGMPIVAPEPDDPDDE